jgi:hypothetical protein
VNWLGRVFRKSKLETQLDSELRFHVEQQTADYVAAGMNPDEARRRALAQFGGLEYIKEETRDARGTYFIESLLQDIRYGLRMVAPRFAALERVCPLKPEAPHARIITQRLPYGSRVAAIAIMKTAGLCVESRPSSL